MIGFNEIPKPYNNVEAILDKIRESNGYIVIPYENWNKFKKYYRKITLTKKNKLILESFYLRSVPIIPGGVR